MKGKIIMQRVNTNVCKTEVGEDLDDLKKAMLYCLDNYGRNNEVYGIFNGQLYVAYTWAKTIQDINLY